MKHELAQATDTIGKAVGNFRLQRQRRVYADVCACECVRVFVCVVICFPCWQQPRHAKPPLKRGVANQQGNTLQTALPM